MRARARLAVDQHTAGAERGEVQRQQHADGSAADDDDARCAGIVRHGCNVSGLRIVIALTIAGNNCGRFVRAIPI